MRSSAIIAKAIENMSFGNVIAGGAKGNAGSNKSLHEKRMEKIVNKFRVESRFDNK